MSKKEKTKHLGRGLQSLLSPINSFRAEQTEVIQSSTEDSNMPPDIELRESLRELSIESISPNPYQPRTVWNDQDLADLEESIKANGIIQPIIVRPSGSKYQIIAGERRFRAAKLASMKTIPALVRTASDKQLLELSLVENIHRVGLNPIERATNY